MFHKCMHACIMYAYIITYVWIFIYLEFYVAFNTVQVISQRVFGRAEETSTYSLSGSCTVNCRPTASNYQLSHLRPCREPNPGLRGGRRDCYHSATVAHYICMEVEVLDLILCQINIIFIFECLKNKHINGMV